jgi:hypothetical protein
MAPVCPRQVSAYVSRYGHRFLSIRRIEDPSKYDAAFFGTPGATQSLDRDRTPFGFVRETERAARIVGGNHQVTPNTKKSSSS